jgi:hypothetical protein
LVHGCSSSGAVLKVPSIHNSFDAATFARTLERLGDAAVISDRLRV